MVGHQGTRGESPLTAVNIETLISAVRLLAKRESHEVAPFVTSWSTSLSNFSSRHLPNSSAESLLQAILSSQNSSSAHTKDTNAISEAVASIALAAVKPDMNAPFKDAEEFILETLVELLSKPTDVSYLHPLIDLSQNQPGGLDIITLNYDLTVEKAAAELDIDFCRGVEFWTPGSRLQFPKANKQLNIIKLHGSLDWRSNFYTDVNLGPLLPRGIDIVDLDNMQPSDQHKLPWIVVGDRDKLGTDGPTLELNFAARNALSSAKHLLVVGYSFGDSHVNAMIRDWLANIDEERTITVLDYDWPIMSDRKYQRGNFKTDLVWEYGQLQDRLNYPVKPRMLPVVGTAREKLRVAIGLRPGQTPNELATAAAFKNADFTHVTITWNGPELHRVQISAEPISSTESAAAKTTLFTEHPPAKRGRMEDIYSQPAVLDKWESGTDKTVYARSDIASSLLLRISGESILGRQSAHLEVNLVDRRDASI